MVTKYVDEFCMQPETNKIIIELTIEIKKNIQISIGKMAEYILHTYIIVGSCNQYNKNKYSKFK